MAELLPRGGPGPHHSPALEVLVAGLTEGGSLSVLDLGPAVGPSVAFLSRFSTRLHVADLAGTLAADPTLGARLETEPHQACGALLPQPDRPYDLVFAWDAWNYVGPGAVAAMARHLAGLCRPGAQLLAFFWAHGEVPEVPLRYRIEGPGTLGYDGAGGGRLGPAYSPGEVERLLQPWAAERMFLLRHGLREHLLSLPGRA